MVDLKITNTEAILKVVKERRLVQNHWNEKR